MSLIETKKRLAIQLFDIGAIKFGSFRLKLHEKNPDAPLSPIYIDLRVLRRFPEAKEAAVNVYEELVRPLKFDLLADIPTAATPLVSSLSDRLGVGMVTPRLDTKGYGSGVKVDGALASDKGKRVVLIDDLITRADSKLEAAGILKSQGFIVEDVVVLIDRGQGGAEQLAEAGYKLHSALTMNQILKFYLDTGKINQAVYKDVIEKLEALESFF